MAQKVGQTLVQYCVNNANKSKEVPLQTWSGPEGSRKLSFQNFMTTAHDDGKK
jgi:hypothetical protein